jgi:class 3 adenylate cyclase
MLTMPSPSIPGERTKATQVIACLAFRFLAAVDIEGFSRRSAAGQAKIQDDLEYAMSQAAASAALDRRRWYRQPCGDGELAVLPPNTNGLSLVADYPRRLALVLAEINRFAEPGARLRVRMAIHHGAVSPGRFGPVGSAPIVVSRLVDSHVLRQKLRERKDLDIALIVSQAVYDEVVQSRFHDLDPQTFRRTSIRSKGTSSIGYLYQSCLLAQDPTTTAINMAPRPAVSPTQTRRLHQPLGTPELTKEHPAKP